MKNTKLNSLTISGFLVCSISNIFRYGHLFGVINDHFSCFLSGLGCALIIMGIFTMSKYFENSKLRQRKLRLIEKAKGK